MSLIKQYYRIYSRYDAAAIANSPLGRLMLLTWSISGKVLWKLGRLDRKPWFTRSSMFSVRHILPEAKRRHNEPFILPPDVKELKDLRVGCVVDDFTLLAFSPECQMLSVTSADWKESLLSFRPHLLLVESAWMGKEESWKWKVSVMSPELVELVVWCKRNGIPTVFWNKEDPKHYETFIRATELFDVVFTTDADCIAEYRFHLGTDRVHLLPFAAQPKMHNPIETYDRKDSFCFAGSYYTQQMDRNITFSRFVTAISSLGELEIFDRYLNTQDVRMSFPDRYKRFIVGTLPPENMDRAYKGYTYGVNMNTIKGSQTMFARRVFELLASNTICVGNYSRGLRNFLGDLTVCTDDVEWFKHKIVSLQRDRQDRDKYRLLGLRVVMSEHTYRHRLEHVVRCTFDRGLDLGMPLVTVLCIPKDREELDQAWEAYQRQIYEPKEFLAVVEDGMGPSAREGQRTIERGELDAMVEGGLAVGHLSFFSPQDHYGRNYLADLALGASWSGVQAVGKACFYQGDGADEVDLDKEYRFVLELDWRSSLVDVSSLHVTPKELMNMVQGGKVQMPVCLSLDRFNYCREHQSTCSSAQDLEVVDQGIPFEEMEEQLKEQGGKGDVVLGKSDVLFLYGTFPISNRAPAFNFLHTCPDLARANGRMVDVARLNKMGDTGYYALRDVDVAHVPRSTVSDMLSSGAYHHLQVHMLNLEVWRCIRPYMDLHRTEVWVYGPEIVLPKLPERSEHYRHERRDMEDHAREVVELWRQVFSSKVDLVFASEHLARTAMEQVGMPLEEGRYRVRAIPVDPSIYHAADRSADRRYRVLCVRPYAGTLMDLHILVDTIVRLSSSPEFNDIHFTLSGSWSRYEEVLVPLRGYENVRIHDADLVFEAKAEMYRQNGILLAPYSADPHGGALAEAMACGLVPVVSEEGAVREIADDGCAVITPLVADDLANAILGLIDDPGRFIRMSEMAVQRIGRTRGPLDL